MDKTKDTFWAELGRIEGWGVGRCLGCGGSLQHLAFNRCPECGREFDPADPKTMDMEHTHRPLLKRILTRWRARWAHE